MTRILCFLVIFCRSREEGKCIKCLLILFARGFIVSESVGLKVCIYFLYRESASTFCNKREASSVSLPSSITVQVVLVFNRMFLSCNMKNSTLFFLKLDQWRNHTICLPSPNHLERVHNHLLSLSDDGEHCRPFVRKDVLIERHTWSDVTDRYTKQTRPENSPLGYSRRQDDVWSLITTFYRGRNSLSSQADITSYHTIAALKEDQGEILYQHFCKIKKCIV